MMKSTVRQTEKIGFRIHLFNILIGLAMAYAVIYAINFVYTHERVDGPSRYQINPEVKKNRYFASQLLLQQQNKQVELLDGEMAHTRLKQIWQQPEQQAKQSLVMVNTLNKSQENNLDNILAWVERGGHLITFSQTLIYQSGINDEQAIQKYYQDENILFQRLGLMSVNKDYDDDETTAKDEELQKVGKINLKRKLVMQLPYKNSLSKKEIIFTENSYHLNSDLNSDKFWQQFSKPPYNSQYVVDYDIFKKVNNQYRLKNPELFTTLLSQKQIEQLQNTLALYPKKVSSVTKFMFDVKFGQGRITVINQGDLFNSPKSYDINDIVQIKKEASQTAQSKSTQSRLATFLEQDNRYYSTNLMAHDNAHLLNYLTQDRQQLWLVQYTRNPSFFALLWQHLRWTMVALMIAIVMGLLAMPKRFGRIRPYQIDTATNIFNYFAQIGQYLWQTDQARQLVLQNRQFLLDKIVATHGNLMNKFEINQPLLCQTVAKEMQMDIQDVKRALYDDWQNSSEFVEISQIFAQIVKHYQ